MRRGIIRNGPYLLGPGARQMTVVWETAQMADSFAVVCMAADGTEVRREAVCTKEPACPEHPAGALLHTAVMTGLSPDTEYVYEILCGDTSCQRSSFRTLQEAPSAIHLMTVSDSHLFYASDFFRRAAERERPDFILHTGDISFGTGYQHDQYQDNWFQRIPDLLAYMPVVYAHGNHDDGPFYDTLIGGPQGRAFHAMGDGHNFSFDYGMAHVTVVDSNPWSLLEMNGINAGISPDDALRHRIQSVLAWAEEDLSSEAARRAAWRILVMHHPYTDAFNNRYIVPIAERCGADLVLGGHVHYYIKAVSVQPDRGARTVYVCQGSAQDAAADFERADGTERLLTEFPEVAALGNNNYGILDVTEDAIDYKLYGFLPDGTEKLIDIVHMTKEAPKVAFSGIELRALDAHGQVKISGTAENRGTGIASAVLPLADNDEMHLLQLFGHGDESQCIVLDPGEKRVFTAFYRAEATGEHVLRVMDATLSIEVSAPAALSYAHLLLRLGEGMETDCLFASVEVTNCLQEACDVSIPLIIDGQVAAVQNLSFAARERRSISFCHRFERAGVYLIGIADQIAKEVRVEGALRIVPRVYDKTGKGHAALLHGTPKVVEKDGSVEVALESYGDYIEILPCADLATPEGLTGMVRANLYRLARADEMGHSPLMIRGKSIGWGAGYCLRMAVERSGAIKWGVCHGVEEYFWQGGTADVGVWHQYAMRFDKVRGGASFIDGVCLGRIGGIDPASELRQWADQPIFVGFSYIGHVIPALGKPKYFTHLPAYVSEVRFYTEGLSEEEVRSVYAYPERKGPRDESLAVWLDFRRIETDGTHTTEWRHPAVYAPAYLAEKIYWQFKSLRAYTRIPGHASIRATVEVSDDQVSIKDARTFILEDGVNEMDLSDLSEAQYLRIVTELSAEVGETGTFIPELISYEAAAVHGSVRANVVWSTRAQWERGALSGAAGFPPVDRQRDYPEYTDIIHG